MINYAKKKLALVGSGIKSLSHFTTEFKAYTKKADKVLYLVNEPIVQEWITKNTKHPESLENIYFSNSNRLVSYAKITQKIIDELDKYDFVTVIIYGHPTVFAEPGLNAILQAEKLSIETIILPGISAENCLYADLKIDPGRFGCFHVEATEFLLFDKQIDPTAHLIIWQIGMIANMAPPEEITTSKYINFLQERLLEIYPNEQESIIYEASLYPGLKPKINRFALKDLKLQNVNTLSTLYISPIKQNKINLEMLEKLSLCIKSLSLDL